jgi:hypothetical protein
MSEMIFPDALLAMIICLAIVGFIFFVMLLDVIDKPAEGVQCWARNGVSEPDDRPVRVARTR